MAQRAWWGIVWLSGVVCCLATAHVQAGTIRYVNNASPTCQDHAPCYASIQAGIDAAQAGDTVRIQAGTYTEQLLIQGKNAHTGASEADRIVVEADPTPPGEDVVLHGAVSQCTLGHAIRVMQSYFVTIHGLIITNTGGQAISLLGGINENSHVHIERNRIIGNGSHSCNGGITVNRGNPETVIANNLIYGNGRNGITFLDEDGGPHYVIANTISANAWNGVEVARDHHAYVVNNLLVHNGQASGTTGGRYGVVREDSTTPLPSGIHLLHNLVCGNLGGELHGPMLNNDDDSGNLTPTGTEGPGVSVSVGCHNLSALFANIDGTDQIAGNLDDDFSLALSSPALDRGLDPRAVFPSLPVPVLEADYLGVNHRPKDGDRNGQVAFDIGAIEEPGQDNQPPAANAGLDQAAHVNQTVYLDGSGSTDIDLPPGEELRFHWTVKEKPPGSIAQLVGATTSRPRLTVDKEGDYVVELIVKDEQNAESTPDEVAITTRNVAPQADAGLDQHTTVGTVIQLDGSSSSDADGDRLTAQWVFVDIPEGSTTVLSDPSSIRPTFFVDLPGSYVLDLVVSDGLHVSTPSRVTISTANVAPVANAGPDQRVATGQTVQVNGAASFDANPADVLTFFWSFTERPTGSAASLTNATSLTPSFVADVPGVYILQLQVDDGVANDADTVLISTTGNVRPVAQAGPNQALLLGASVALNGAQSNDADGDTLSYHWALIFAPANSSAALANATTATPSLTPDGAGLYVLQLIVADGVVESAPDAVVITITSPDTTPPARVEIARVSVGSVTGGQAIISGSAGSVEGHARVYLTNVRTGQTVSVLASAEGRFSAHVPADVGDEIVIIVKDGANNASPPCPILAAPPVNQTVATTLIDAVSFLYTGPHPTQTGVNPAAITPQRIAVLRGTVLNQAGNPLPGVTITVLNHPEFGQTLSRTDGRFDLVVNGGGLLTVDYRKADYLPAQRQVQAPWQEYVALPDVTLMALEQYPSTQIDLSSSAPIQVLQGRLENDAAGSRQATLFFPAGTTLRNPDGTVSNLSTLTVRAVEYTVGSNGPQQMPAELPPSSAYTYAVELMADEVSAGAQLKFAPAIPLYVDNFVNFPVGGVVPVGTYDRVKGEWVPADNGTVIKILGSHEENGNFVADVDTNGDGQADNALGLSDPERQQLAQFYPVGRSLWRVAVSYFSAYDCNWPGGPPADAITPDGASPVTGNELDLDDPDRTADGGGAGSSIAYQNQTVRQQVELVGMPLMLTYQSDRVRGYLDAYSVTIPLSGDNVPASVKRIDLKIQVAGQRLTRRFVKGTGPGQYVSLTNLTDFFTWDGKDAYGRPVQGRQKMSIAVEFVYDVVYQSPTNVQKAFGRLSRTPLPTANPRSEVVTGRRWTGPLGAWDAKGQGLGGWTVDAHHSYDPIGQTLYLGDGRQHTAVKRRVGSFGVGLTTVAGGGSGTNIEGELATEAVLRTPDGLAVGQDGSLYIADSTARKVYQVNPDGNMMTYAGNGDPGYSGDGLQATAAKIGETTGVAIGRDGSLYLSDVDGGHVRRVDPLTRVIETIAGCSTNNNNTDCEQRCQVIGDRPCANFVEGSEAAETELLATRAVAAGPDGSVYIADTNARRVFRVDRAGLITTFAGNGKAGFHSSPGDFNGPATGAPITPWDVAVGPDGGVYIATQTRVLRVDQDGIVRVVAGPPTLNAPDGDPIGEGIPATTASFGFITGIAVANDGTIYIADSQTDKIRRVAPDGRITTVAGTGTEGFTPDGALPAQAQIRSPQGVAIGLEGSVYFSDAGTGIGFAPGRVRGIRSVFPIFKKGTGETIIASEDGSELYYFDGFGQHQKTVNALTGATLYTFDYDAQGRLAKITDSDENETTIQRDGSGNPTITGPYGQATVLKLDTNGYVDTITNPLQEKVDVRHDPDGLIRGVKQPSQTPPGEYTFNYDASGRVSASADPAQGGEHLTRTLNADGYTVTSTTAANRQSTYQVKFSPSGKEERINTLPDGTRQTTEFEANGLRKVTQPDGMTQNITYSADPRFSMQAPLPTALSVQTPAGTQGTLTATRTVPGANPATPLDFTTQTDTVAYSDSVSTRTATRIYDKASRTFTDISPANRTRTTTLDSQGRVTQQQQGTLTATQFTYDAQGRLSTRTQGVRSSTMTYDTLGRLATITDPSNRVVQFQYDAAGRVTRQTLPDLREITYTYDPNGNVTSISPPGRPPHVFEYTTVNQEKKYTAPSVNGGGTMQTQYAYNADRQLTQITRPDGQSVRLDYDSAGRLSHQTLPTGQITYGYAQTTGNLTTVTSTNTSTVTYTYDGSLLTSSTWSGPIAGTVSWTYDNNYRKTGQSVNGGNTVAFTYDNDDLLTGAGAMTLTRNSNGLLTGSTLENVTDTLTYTGFGEVATYQANASATAMLAEQYTRDNLGRIITKTETIGGVTTTYAYTYDPAGRLTEVKQNGVTTATYTYDANSNRLTGPTGPIAYTYDAQDRLLTAGSTSYTYTANGELLTKTVGSQTTTYSYDVLGNLLRVELPGGDRIDYLVDGENRRIGKKVNGVLVQGFLYENQLEPVAEF